ncbi:MAG: DUF3078 domain-containing protein [Cytophagales bacterium]
MKKIYLLLIIVSFYHFNSYGQDEQSSTPDSLKNWVIGGRIGLNFTNVSLTNWAGGGQESVSGTGNFLIRADYKKNKFKWKNSFEVAYGLIKQGEAPVIKSDDKILFTSELNYNYKPKWSFSNVFTFRSQFAPGYNPPDSQFVNNKISDWLAPGYIQEALGFGYQPTEYLSFFLSPLTAKITLVMDQRLADNGEYGVDAAVRDSAGNIITPGKNIRAEIGASFRMNFNKEVVKNVEFESVLDLFSNYLENPDALDVNWINNLNMKINDFMTASVLTQLIYDQDIKIAAENDPTDIAPRTQFKSVIGIGITYKF